MDDLNPKKMKVAELREALAERQLPTTGVKKDLVTRLEEALDRELLGEDDDLSGGPTAGAGNKGGDDDAADDEDEEDEEEDQDDEGEDEGDEEKAAQAPAPAPVPAPAVPAPAPAAAASPAPAPAAAAAGAEAEDDGSKPTDSEEMRRLLGLLARAKRFGKDGEAGRLEDLVKRQRRADRFGIKPQVSTAAVLARVEGKGKGKGKAEGKEARPGKRDRDGAADASKPKFARIGGGVTVSAEEEAKRKRRLERFGKA